MCDSAVGKQLKPQVHSTALRGLCERAKRDGKLPEPVPPGELNIDQKSAKIITKG